MTIFFYDKTFEGLLCVVFEAYSQKLFPDALLPAGDNPPLFVDYTQTVVSDRSKSERVWTGLQKKLEKNACNMLLHVWLSELEGTDILLFRYMRKIFDSKEKIEYNFGDNDVLEISRIARKVSHEALYIKQFIRFQKAAGDIFFAPVRPLYNALPLAVEHFTDRFADQQWIVYDLNRNYGYYYDLQTTNEITFSDDNNLMKNKLDEALMAEDEKIFQDLWKEYFKAITIKERLNLRLHRQHLPVRFWKYLTEKQ
jgi:probable DNA metabolism protein